MHFPSAMLQRLPDRSGAGSEQGSGEANHFILAEPRPHAPATYTYVQDSWFLDVCMLHRHGVRCNFTLKKTGSTYHRRRTHVVFQKGVFYYLKGLSITSGLCITKMHTASTTHTHTNDHAGKGKVMQRPKLCLGGRRKEKKPKQ